MTYQEAVKRVEDVWYERLKDPALPLLCAVDREALAVLRRAEGVMGAVENCRIEGDAYGDDSPMAEPHELRVILRESLRYKEQAK